MANCQLAHEWVIHCGLAIQNLNSSMISDHYGDRRTETRVWFRCRSTETCKAHELAAYTAVCWTAPSNLRSSTNSRAFTALLLDWPGACSLQITNVSGTSSPFVIRLVIVTHCNTHSRFVQLNLDDCRHSMPFNYRTLFKSLSLFT